MTKREKHLRDKASSRLDKAAWSFAAQTLLLQENSVDDGTAANHAWRELQRAAVNFAKVTRRLR
jgi:hypothetical protein